LIKKFNVEKTRQLNKVNKILSCFYKKPKCKSEISLSDVERVLIVDFALIGDMVMNIPFLKNIRYNCPGAKITMVCMPWAESVLGDQELVDEFIIFDGKNKLSSPKQVIKNWKDIKNILEIINQNKYQIGLEPKGDLRHTLFMHYTNCERKINYNYTGGEYLVTDSFMPIPGTVHLIDEKIDLLRMAGFKIDTDVLLPQFKLTDKTCQMVNKFIMTNDFEGKIIVGLHPGASNTNKQYKHYPEIVKKMIERYGDSIKFCIFEGAGEANIVDAVCSKVKQTQYVRVKRSLKEYISLVSCCNCMICNDSAAGHIAAAYGIPVLVIFGPVRAETAAPRGYGKVITISKDLNCKPCTLPECPLGTERCIESINVEEVWERVQKLMLSLVL
jgi:heptosyltransferase-2